MQDAGINSAHITAQSLRSQHNSPAERFQLDPAGLNPQSVLTPTFSRFVLVFFSAHFSISVYSLACVH